MHPNAHKTMWTVVYLRSGACARFKSEEAASIRALEDGDVGPVALIPPIYA